MADERFDRCGNCNEWARHDLAPCEREFGTCTGTPQPCEKHENQHCGLFRSRPDATPPDQLTCPRCDNTSREEAEFCWYCGCHLASTPLPDATMEPDPKLPARCLNCAITLGTDAIYCGRCGYKQ